MSIVILGYASGIIHKILFSMDWVILLYILNLLLVAVDLSIYFRYSRRPGLSIVDGQ
jgi:hypothetical protein